MFRNSSILTWVLFRFRRWQKPEAAHPPTGAHSWYWSSLVKYHFEEIFMDSSMLLVIITIIFISSCYVCSQIVMFPCLITFSNAWYDKYCSKNYEDIFMDHPHTGAHSWMRQWYWSSLQLYSYRHVMSVHKLSCFPAWLNNIQQRMIGNKYYSKNYEDIFLDKNC